MSKQDVVKIQSFVLRVNVHCDGCKKKIKRQLKKIEGVYSISMDAEQGKVTVSGTVDPSTLIKKLEKSGKHAVLCGSQKGASNNIQNPPKNMFQNIPLDNFKVGKDNKSQKGWSGKDQPKQHLPQQQQQQLDQQQLIQQLKGNIKDQKLPSKDPRTVKFNLPEEDFGATDSDSYDDECDDDFDDEYYDDDEDYDDDDEFGGPSKTIPITGKGSNAMMNGQSKNDKGQKGGGGGGKNGKKGEVFDVLKDMGGKKEKNEKNGGKDKKGSGGNETGKIGVLLSILKGKGGKNDAKSAGKKGGGGDGKNNKNGGGGGNKGSGDGGGGNKGSGDGGNGKGNGKKGGGKNEGSQGMKNAFPDQNVLKHVKGVGGLNKQMGNFPAVQGQPAFAAAMNGGGYYPGMNQGMGMGMGMGPPAANSYNNPQYMAMMMNQHGANATSEMLHPMMYSRPPPPMGYMPPPMPSHPMADPYTHIFSDENTGSCSIM